MDNQIRTYLILAGFVGAIVGLWIAATEIWHVEPIFLPSPTSVIRRLFEGARSGVLWLDIGASFARITAGFVLSVTVALIVVGGSNLIPALAMPVQRIAGFLRYLPIPAFAPLAIFWFGLGEFAKIFLIFLGTFCQLIPMLHDVFEAKKAQYISIFESLHLSNASYFWNIIIPASAPLLWDCGRIAFGWAWTYLIVGEIFVADAGLGSAILRAQRYILTDVIFAYLITIGCIGSISDLSLRYLGRTILWWGRAR